MNLKTIAGFLLLAVGTAGCLSAPFQPPTGFISNYSAPLSTEGNLKAGSKTGKAEAVCVLGIVATGDCSLDTAIRNGGLKSVSYADYEYLNVLGIYRRVILKAIGD